MIALTPEMVELLRKGAATYYGRICYPKDTRANWRHLAPMHQAGLFYWGENGETPIITDAGRRAVDGPSLTELHIKETRPFTYEGLADD
jgi:hypothetical protein